MRAHASGPRGGLIAGSSVLLTVPAMTNRPKKVLITVAALAALALGGSALAGASSGREQGENDKAVPGAAAARAEKAALAETGGGKANELEYDNENGATYEVEVTKPGGSTVDVRLDDRFGVVVVEGDSDEEGEEDGPDQGADRDPDEPGHQD